MHVLAVKALVSHVRIMARDRVAPSWARWWRVAGAGALLACGGGTPSRPSAATCPSPESLSCAPAGTPAVTLSISSQDPVPGLELQNVVRGTAAGSTPVGWTCDGGERQGRAVTTTCTLGDGTGGYEIDVMAPGFHTEHVSATVPPPTANEAACCPSMHGPSTYFPQTIAVALWPLPTAACTLEFTGEDARTAAAPAACQVEADLAAPADGASSCSGLVPPRVEGRSFRLHLDGWYDCGDPTSDGVGTLTAPIVEPNLYEESTAAFWGGDGSWSRRQDLESVNVDGAWVVPAPSGFLYVDGHYVVGQHLFGLDDLGDVVKKTVSDYCWVRVPVAKWTDADGGFLLAGVDTGCADNFVGIHAVRVGPAGDVLAHWPVASIAATSAMRSEFPYSMTSGIAAADDGQGHVLVVWEGASTCGVGTIAGRWFDREGKPLTGAFRAASATDAPQPVPYLSQPKRLQPLTDGSLVLQTRDGAWVRRFVAPIPAGNPAPSWLAARPGWDLQIVRGGQAYAAIDPDACHPRIEVLSPAGEVCGTLDYPAPPAGSAACDPGTRQPSLTIGVDGTVMRLASITPSPTGQDCEYQWWSGELR